MKGNCVRKGRNGRKLLRRLKPTVGFNASKRRRRRSVKILDYYNITVHSLVFNKLNISKIHGATIKTLNSYCIFSVTVKLLALIMRPVQATNLTTDSGYWI
jgi:hypothetical protein